MPCTSFDKLNSIEPAYLPASKLGILIDWLVTLKCNYDCSYCDIGMHGHNNSIPHPDYDRCLGMLKQLYAYTDVMMMKKKDRLKDAIMNMYGGEAVFHPQFVQLAEATTREFEQYKDRWRLHSNRKKLENYCQPHGRCDNELSYPRPAKTKKIIPSQPTTSR